MSGAALAVAFAMAPGAACATAGGPSDAEPIGLAVSSRFGAMVDEARATNVCASLSGDACEAAVPGSEPGWFEYPSGVAADPRTGDIYVADKVNNRVQELTAQGSFVEMFGWDVNRTKDADPAATQAQRNLCMAWEVETAGAVCGKGTPGTGPEQFSGLTSLAVDPVSGDVYTEEATVGNYRVARYTPRGRIVWMAGGGVNETTHGNLCTELEVRRRHVKCGAGREAASRARRRGVFRFGSSYGDLLAVGGPRRLLYVGDEQRVQMLSADGRWSGEAHPARPRSWGQAQVAAVAVGARGVLFSVYRFASGSAPGGGPGNVVVGIDPTGRETLSFPVLGRTPAALLEVNALAVDAADRVMVIAVELGGRPVQRFGEIFDGASGQPLARFLVVTDNDGIAVSAGDALYLAATDQQEIVVYQPFALITLVTSPTVCRSGARDDAAWRFDCELADGAAP
jgi:hypothetical protein